ncbi:MAG TPA: hypothetical protein VGO93_27100 [Candidatus Xenobia bacterium]|jgi:CheY-like chemotaxis protein
MRTIVIRVQDRQERQMLEQVLHGMYPHQLQVVGADGVDDVLRLVVSHAAELVVTDFHVPHLPHYDPLCDEIKAIRYLRRRHQPVQTIVLAGEEDDSYRSVCESAGAAAFLTGGLWSVLRAVEKALPGLVRDEAELVFSDRDGEVLYHHGSEQPLERAELNSFLGTQATDLIQVLGTGPLGGLSIQGPGFEIWYEHRDEVSMFTRCAPAPGAGPPPPGFSLRDSLQGKLG